MAAITRLPPSGPSILKFTAAIQAVVAGMEGGSAAMHPLHDMPHDHHDSRLSRHPHATSGSTTKNNNHDSFRLHLHNDLLHTAAPTATASSSFASSSSSLARKHPAATIAARLATDADCSFDPGTPRYLASIGHNPSSQCRLVVSSAPPHRVCYASPEFHALTGYTAEQIQGRPALAVLLSAQPTRHAEPLHPHQDVFHYLGDGVDSIMASMALNMRGCSTLACRKEGMDGYFPAKVTVSPLMDAHGEKSHMVVVVQSAVEEA